MATLSRHPNKEDMRLFAVDCQIDPLFDEKYMPFINSAIHDPLPAEVVMVLDPENNAYYHNKETGDASREHPHVPRVRDDVQDMIAHDEKMERERLEALNPLSPEERAAKQKKAGKRAIKQANEMVMLDLKKAFGSPDVEDVKRDSSVEGYYTVDPMEVIYAYQKLGINPNKISEKRYMWMARMCVVCGIPEGWSRGEDKEDKKKGLLRQYRLETWENEKLFVSELPAFKFWKSVLKAAREDDAVSDESRVVVEADWNMFVKDKTGRAYFYDFFERITTFTDGGTDDVEEEEPEKVEEEDVPEKAEEAEEEGGTKLKNLLSQPVCTEAMIKELASDSNISWKDVQQNGKMKDFLKTTLLEDLPDGFVRYITPEGKNHYYSASKNISTYRNPRAEGVQVRHEKAMERKKKIKLNQRLTRRQTMAMDKAIMKQAAHVAQARLMEHNKEITEASKLVYSELPPDEECLVFYKTRYGDGDTFVSDAMGMIMDEINSNEGSVEGLTPAQVVQMALFFGIKPSEEPHLMCVAMLAVLAPLPPFWYVVEEEEEGEEGGERVNVKTIDFSISDQGGISFTPKEEQGARLMYARDLDANNIHTQKEHPSDEFWRKLTENARATTEFLSDSDKFRVSILPFFNQDATGGEKLYYYNFETSNPIFATPSGEFSVTNGMGGGNLSLPKEVGGQRGGYYEKRRRITINQFKSKKRHSTIFKYKPPKELQKGNGKGATEGVKELMKVSVSSPLFLPPIPASIKEEDASSWEGQQGLLAAESWMLSEGEGETREREEEKLREELERPRTKQDEKRIVKGSLFVGFSGMQRPLAHVQKKGLVNGRGGTPWQDRTPSRGITEADFEGLVRKDVYKLTRMIDRKME